MRSVRLPSAPPSTNPSATAVIGLVCRNAVTTIAADTEIVASTKNHGRSCPRLKAPPGFVAKRNVRTPGITSIGRPGSRASAQPLLSRSMR